MATGNPVFTRTSALTTALKSGRITPTPGDLSQMYGQNQSRQLTMADVLTKTTLLFAVLLTTGTATWVTHLPLGFAALAGLIGFGLALVNIFKSQVVPALVLAYAACEGVFVGGISASYEGAYHGIVAEAAVCSAVVFGSVLAGYRSGLLRNTPKFRKIVLIGFFSLFTVIVINMVLALFMGGDPLGIRGGNTGLSIAFSLAFIGIGSMTFVTDFDTAEQMVAGGAQERESWRIGFGFVVGVVWLYVEMLRLLSYLRD